MSKKNRNREALIDIYNAGQEILAFTDGISQQDLELNKEKRNATLYSIQIIGEATKRLSTEFRQTNAHIPWRKMAGMRDKIVHEYNKTDLNLVWEVARYGIPKLLEQIEVFLPEKSEPISSSTYKLYAQNSQQRGLAGAKEIAMSAFADGVEREQIIEMLSQNNSAYQDLVAVGGEKTAQKVVVQKAEVELKLRREAMSSESQEVENKQSKSKGL